MLHKTTGLPGRSKEHTPIKLRTFRIVFGRECGIQFHGQCYTNSNPCFRYYELTAGDGDFNGDINSTSISIGIRMCKDLAKKEHVRMTLYEKKREPYHKLIKNIPAIANRLGFELIRKQKGKERHLFIAAKGYGLKLNIETRRANSEKLTLPQRPKQAQFINCDGNSAQQTPIAVQSVVRQLTEATTFMVSMGFNASGVKVLHKKHRDKWLGFVSSLTASMPVWHDCIIVVVHTGHQWPPSDKIAKREKVRLGSRSQKKSTECC